MGVLRKKYIAHLDLDCFFVSVERVKNPSLNGKPVIVGGSASGRGVVASASYEARAFGVRSAMPTAQALRLCPQAIVVSGGHEEYSEYSRKLHKYILKVAPVVERASIDEMYMDFTGCESLYNNDLPGFMKILQRRIWEEYKLPCTIALASNKSIAKIAAGTVKPAGCIFIPHGTEKQFLAPLPLDALPGVGAKTGEVLEHKGFHTISDVQGASREHLMKLLGRYGEYLYRAANGEGSDRVHEEHIRKSISREETFSQDIRNVDELEKILYTLVESVCSTLRTHHWKGKTVTLKLRYADFHTITRQQSIEPTNYDPLVFAAANELLHKAYDKKMAVRLLGVGLSQFSDETESDLPLFPSNMKQTGMLRVIDRLREKFGDDVIHVGTN